MTSDVGRNDPCPCGSGLKFKKCCQAKGSAAMGEPAQGRAPLPSPAALHRTATAHWEAGRQAEALAVFRTIAQRQPANADAQYNLGATLFGMGRMTEAAEALQRAVALRPSFEIALTMLASALEHLGREDEAAGVYRRLGRVARDPIERRLNLARALNLEGDMDGAEAELRQTLAAKPDSAGAKVLLGQLLLEKGEFEEAETHLAGAVDTFPDAFQHLTMSRRLTEADRPLLIRMAQVAATSDLHPRQRGAVQFGLGKAHDDLGEYEDAMACYETAAALCAAGTVLDRTGLTRHYDQVIANWTADAMRRSAEPLRDAPPDDGELPLLIVGMPRSGTTLVEQILSSHPQVAPGGELSFWRDRVLQWMERARSAASTLDAPRPGPAGPLLKPLAAGPLAALSAAAAVRPPAPGIETDPGRLALAADDYLALLRKIGPEALRVTDKAPFNFERLGEIRAALPGIRILHCRRHPVDTCLSIFFTNYKGRQAWGRADILYQYRQYQRLMAHWRAVLEPDRFIEVDYEAMVTDRETQTRRLIAFAGLAWDDACLAPQANRRVVRTSSLWQARQTTYTGSLERWRRYEPWLGEFRELLADAAVAA